MLVAIPSVCTASEEGVPRFLGQGEGMLPHTRNAPAAKKNKQGGLRSPASDARARQHLKALRSVHNTYGL